MRIQSAKVSPSQKGIVGPSFPYVAIPLYIYGEIWFSFHTFIIIFMKLLRRIQYTILTLSLCSISSLLILAILNFKGWFGNVFFAFYNEEQECLCFF